MTAKAFAGLLQAQRTSSGRWNAHCPAHNDRSPSLSIREGDDGRVLLFCHAGCTLDSILAALKLGKRDLFVGPPPSADRLAALKAVRIAAERHKRAARATDREAWDKVRRLAAVVEALGAKLASKLDDAPEADALTKIFHDACERLGNAETAALELSGRKGTA